MTGAKLIGRHLRIMCMEHPPEAVPAMQLEAPVLPALEELLPQIYEELRRIARRHLRGERADHTLQTTALIHEAYLRIADGMPSGIRDRVHFVALTARLMRQILIDHARARAARKRHGGERVTMNDAFELAASPQIDVLVVDEALHLLMALDPRQAHIVELRFFGGMSIAETAQALGISAATVKREWTVARAWLRRELSRRSA